MLVVSSLTSYMFGWHVHEKAILLSILPLIPVALIDPNLYQAFFRLSLFGTYSILPLLFQHQEYIIKMTIFIAYHLFISRNKPSQPTSKRSLRIEGDTRLSIKNVSSKLLESIDFILIIGLFVNETYINFVFGRLDYPWNPLSKLNKFTFLPLLTTSSLSALGITTTYLELYFNFIASPMSDTN